MDTPEKATILILGAGKIGRAAYRLLNHLRQANDPTSAFHSVQVFIADKDPSVLELEGGALVDVQAAEPGVIEGALKALKITHVINSLPFFLNVKVAQAAFSARCHYIDFTEDDLAAAAVAKIYENSPLFCAPKCGLAPGFVNYVGVHLIAELHKELSAAAPGLKFGEAPGTFEHLKVRVGALPRNVSYSTEGYGAANAYALSWSIDGLVNEYIRPCQVRRAGERVEVSALGGEEMIVINGTQYEARYTSGGIGSLIDDFDFIPNVDYKTIRYPGHYAYVQRVGIEAGWDFDRLRARFEKDFAWTTDDVIVVYAEARAVNKQGRAHVKTFAERYVGTSFGTGIEVTTAGGALAVLELMLRRDYFFNPTIRHRDIELKRFMETEAFKLTYGQAKCS